MFALLASSLFLSLTLLPFFPTFPGKQMSTGDVDISMAKGDLMTVELDYGNGWTRVLLEGSGACKTHKRKKPLERHSRMRSFLRLSHCFLHSIGLRGVVPSAYIRPIQASACFFITHHLAFFARILALSHLLCDSFRAISLCESPRALLFSDLRLLSRRPEPHLGRSCCSRRCAT